MKLNLHLLVLRHQVGLQFLRVSKFLQKVQSQFLGQALLGQEHVLQGHTDGRRRTSPQVEFK